MKRILLLAAFIEGGMVMLLELSIPHVITPILGNSVFIWAILICLAVLSLAAGYLLGGRLSKKKESLEKRLITLFLIALFSILTCWSSINGLNSNSFLMGDLGWTYTCIFFGQILPLVVFGATTPLIIECLHKSEEFNVGKIYSLSTIGGLMFSMLTGYLFIPEMGLSKTLLLGALLTAIVLVVVSKAYQQKRIMQISVILCAGVFACFFLKKEFPETDKFNVLYYSEGLNGQLMVSDIKQDDGNGKNRILFINRMGQTWIDYDNSNSIWSYPNLVTALASVQKPGSKSLLLGLGGGIVAKQLNQLAGLRVDAVELDPRIVDISYEYFNLPRAGINVYTEDARNYLNRCDENYNVIIFDVFNGEIAPSHVLSVEAFKRADELLNPNGFLIINFNGFVSGVEGRSGKSLVNTLKASGFKVKMLPTLEQSEEDRNIIYVAYHKEPDWTKATVTINYEKGKYDLNENLVLPLVSDEVVITDDLPLMEKLNLPAARKWRESYYKNFTSKYKKENGIFYIK